MSGAAVAATGAEPPKEDLGPASESESSPPAQNGLAMVIFSGDLDRALAAMIIANGAAVMDLPVTVFFTFWGLSLLRKEGPVQLRGKKTGAEKVFGSVMPRGPDHLRISKMNMGGLGTRMMKKEMAKKHVMSLPELMKSAQDQGVKFIVCTMSMELLGLHKEELLDGLTYGSVATFIEAADQGRMTLFV